MTVPFELQIALRYLLAKRKQAFVSVISLVSTLGVVVGVMATVIALALMTGLQQEYRDRILGSNPHIFVWKASGITDYRAEVQKFEQLPHVVGAAPEILDKALLMSSGSAQAFATIKGVDPDSRAERHRHPAGHAAGKPRGPAALRRAGRHRRRDVPRDRPRLGPGGVRSAWPSATRSRS